MGGDLGYENEFRIPSQTAEGHKIEEIVVDHLRNGGFTEKEIFGIKLAVEEALVPNKTVQIGFTVNEEGFAIEIRDEGPGFNMEDVPDPTDPENLERPTGRGLFLMHAYMTECNFIPPGNVCRMKRLR
jgi:serine/threonine-protein kinase RsbW